MPKLKSPPVELGQIFISERALQMIVYGALLPIRGLKTPDRMRREGVLGTLAKAYEGNGIQIVKEKPPGGGEPRLHVKMALVAQYGVKIQDAAAQAVREVRQRVKQLAGLEVDEVSVKIIGIDESEAHGKNR
jgi:uncharacterized alkaline shock family protein YloU